MKLRKIFISFCIYVFVLGLLSFCFAEEPHVDAGAAILIEPTSRKNII